MDWEKISPHLSKKLDPANVKPAPKGKFGEYVDGHHIVSEANRIFGYGGWSYEITRLQETSRIETSSGQSRVSFLCTVKVHVGDTFKEGSAVGMGAGKADNIGDVIESAVKEAETDALKRALRTYGNTFGLALYDKTQADVGIDLPPFDARAAADRIIGKLRKQPSVEALTSAWKDETDARMDVKAAAPAIYAEIETASKERAAELRPKEQAA